MRVPSRHRTAPGGSIVGTTGRVDRQLQDHPLRQRRPDGLRGLRRGNVVDGDGCDSNCKTTACGNGVRTDTYDARTAGSRSSPPQLLATLLHALGLDPADEEYGLPQAGPVIAELWP